MVYFWDDRDGPGFCGWWFGPKVGGDQVWAYHAERNSSSPPSSGWKIPYDGPVDPTFAIASGRPSLQQHQQQRPWQPSPQWEQQQPQPPPQVQPTQQQLQQQLMQQQQQRQQEQRQQQQQQQQQLLQKKREEEQRRAEEARRQQQAME